MIRRMIFFDKGPARKERKEIKRYAENATNFFELVAIDNAMPVIKGAKPIPLGDQEIRKRVRKAMEAVVEEGELCGKTNDEISFVLQSMIEHEANTPGYNPYRDSVLATLAMVNAVDRVFKMSLEQYPASRFLSGLVGNLHKHAPLGMMHIMGKQLPGYIQESWPYFTRMFEDYTNVIKGRGYKV